MRRKRIIIPAIVGIVVVLVGAFLVSRGSVTTGAQASSRDQVVDVRRGSLAATVNTTGSISPVNQAKLSFRTAGRLKDINVKVGDKVTAGQVLATLDTSEIELTVVSAQSAYNVSSLKLQNLLKGGTSEDLKAAQATYDSAVAKLTQLKAGPDKEDLTIAKATLEKTKVAVQKAQGDYDAISWRNDIAASSQAVTLQQATADYESALATYRQKTAGATDDQIKTAEASVSNAKSQLDNKLNGAATNDAKIQAESLKQAQADLDKAKLNLEGAIIKAPYDGVVATIAGNPGEQVSAGTAVVTLVDLGSLKVDASVDEVDIAKIKVGQTVDYTLDALPEKRFKGKVTSVSPSAVIQQGVASYPIVLEIVQDTDSSLKPGMTTSANVVISQKDGVLVVPARAVKRRGNDRVVDIPAAGGKTEQKVVKVGLSNDQMIEIQDGVAEGEKVVITATTARSGMPGAGMIVGGPPPAGR